MSTCDGSSEPEVHADPLEALYSVDTELYNLPEYYYWDYATPSSVGCPAGGTVAFKPSDTCEAYTFTKLVFSYGFILTWCFRTNYDALPLTL